MTVRAVGVPLLDGTTLDLGLEPGKTITIVGPNGSGKSALSAFLQNKLPKSVNRIFAHRRLWLNSSAPDMSPAQLLDYRQNFDNWDSQLQSRWRDFGDQHRTTAIMSDLINLQNHTNSIIADRARAGDSLEGIDLTGPLQILNTIMAAASLRVRVRLSDNSEFTCTNDAGEEYPAAEMSDGEKAALLLIADVLVADPGTIHLIDEPERHLHRSISASLIASLTQERNEDTFVIFTHDLELAQALATAGPTYVTAGCTWVAKVPEAWDLRVVPPAPSLPEDVRRAVLGGRSKVVFHEGALGGLDQQVYEVLFRGQTVTPVGNCTAVLRAVAGLRESAALHWLTARGIVDKDFRREGVPEGVYQLAFHEIENVFYTQLCLQWMSQAQAAVYGCDASELEVAALDARHSALTDQGVRSNILNKQRLQRTRDALMDKVLSLTTIDPDGTTIQVMTTPLTDIGVEYDSALSNLTFSDEFLQHFPIRESGVRMRVAKELKFPTAELYEQAVIQQLRLEDGFRERVVAQIGLADLLSD
jgi:ABC-type lipoprotein export system ATPase subunit